MIRGGSILLGLLSNRILVPYTLPASFTWAPSLCLLPPIQTERLVADAVRISGPSMIWSWPRDCVKEFTPSLFRNKRWSILWLFIHFTNVIYAGALMQIRTQSALLYIKPFYVRWRNPQYSMNIIQYNPMILAVLSCNFFPYVFIFSWTVDILRLFVFLFRLSLLESSQRHSEGHSISFHIVTQVTKWPGRLSLGLKFDTPGTDRPSAAVCLAFVSWFCPVIIKKSPVLQVAFSDHS